MLVMDQILVVYNEGKKANGEGASGAQAMAKTLCASEKADIRNAPSAAVDINC
jgi:hypothetical protein